MSLFKNPAEIIAEAARVDLEMDAGNNILTESVINTFKEETSGIPTLEDGYMVYTEEVVPVFEYKGCAIVEMDNLVKYMASNNVGSVMEALNNLGQHYNIDPQMIGVVIESDEDIQESLEEAKKSTLFNMKAKKLDILGQASDSITDLKNAGVKIFKKPGKNQRKKSKRK